MRVSGLELAEFIKSDDERYWPKESYFENVTFIVDGVDQTDNDDFEYSTLTASNRVEVRRGDYEAQ